jgi:N utilization substance protein B
MSWKGWQAKDGEGTGNNVPAGSDVQNFQSHGYKQRNAHNSSDFFQTHCQRSEVGSQKSERRVCYSELSFRPPTSDFLLLTSDLKNAYLRPPKVLVMISRRNIRVKVMQTLYTMVTWESEAKPPDPQKLLQQHFDQVRSLFVYLIYFLTEVSRYAETASHQRASKHLPTVEDLNVNVKIAGNELLWKMMEDPALKEQFNKEKPQQYIDKELLRKIYLDFAATTEYKNYISKGARDKSEEKKILEFILNDMLLANESFVSHVEDTFFNWDDDGEMIIQLLVGYMQKPGTYDFKKMLSSDKEEFAKGLLRTVLEKDEYLQSLIVPKLKNWDPERIALLDMILMKMGVTEFLYFETIPPKVTINEYIDLAKDYSTQQSGQFVNGILDNIHKELVQQGKMQKVEYKKG